MEEPFTGYCTIELGMHRGQPNQTSLNTLQHYTNHTIFLTSTLLLHAPIYCIDLTSHPLSVTIRGILTDSAVSYTYNFL